MYSCLLIHSECTLEGFLIEVKTFVKVKSLIIVILGIYELLDALNAFLGLVQRGTILDGCLLPT